ncbi:holocytochrome c synthase [Ascosphaera atra]|nr:holocytochrome c synthase [Ascosphaera atra]
MGWFWASSGDATSGAASSKPAGHPATKPDASSSECPVMNDTRKSECPVDHTNNPNSPFYVPPKDSTSNSLPSGGAPQEPEQSGASFMSKLNPLNYMPYLSNKPMSEEQKTKLDTERERSSILRGDRDEEWVYPSDQQMFNALQRKGKGAPEDGIAAMVAVHNQLNEGTWNEIKAWERLLSRPLTQAWKLCSMGEENVSLLLEDESEHLRKEEEPRLSRFQGRPNDLSPRATMFQTLARVFPEKYDGTPPFDRHDWFVQRQTPSGPKEVRYVIDYYNGGHDPMGQPQFFVDIRPAVDTPSAAFYRMMRWGGDVWWRASGGIVREAARMQAARAQQEAAQQSAGQGQSQSVGGN